MPAIACPICGKLLKLPRGYAKPRARCPFCHGQFAVANAAPFERPAPTAAPEPDIDFLLLEDAAEKEAAEMPLPVVRSTADEDPPLNGNEVVPVVTVPPRPRRRFLATPIGVLVVLAPLAIGVPIVVFAPHLFGLWTVEPNNSTPEPAPPPILSEKQKAAVGDAIKALARIEAAVQVGVNFQKYTELVIDAKAAVNEADRLLPDCELLTSLDESMRAYGDAATVWNHKIKYSSVGLLEKAYGAVIDRYNLPLREKNGRMEASPDVAMQVMWHVAATKLAAARILQQ